MTTNENKQSITGFLINIFYSKEWMYLYNRIIIYLLIIWVILFYLIWILPSNNEVQLWIKTIKESKIYVHWKNDFVWADKEIDYLKSFLNNQEMIVKDKNKWLLDKFTNFIPNEISNKSSIRFFEDLFLSLSTDWNEMILESINISNPIIETIVIWDKKIVYKKHPVNISFISSYTKKMQFLDIIQASWTTDQRYYFKWIPLPLMTISSVSINITTKKNILEKQNQNVSFFIYSYNEKQNI